MVDRIYGSDGLNERQRIAANYLARGTTIRETARKIGVSEKSVYSWRQRTAVQQAIARIQQADPAFWQQEGDRLASALTAAAGSGPAS